MQDSRKFLENFKLAKIPVDLLQSLAVKTSKIQLRYLTIQIFE